MSVLSHEFFMKQALKEAHKAFEEGEIPVGAVVVAQNQIIARGHNQTEQLNDVTAHAEMLAITSAANFLGGKYLKDCSIYVTLEPCLMCTGALFWAQIGEVIFGASDQKRGFSRRELQLLHPKTEVIPGILKKECENLLHLFFEQRRN